jgi:hypothetical protein
MKAITTPIGHWPFNQAELILSQGKRSGGATHYGWVCEAKVLQPIDWGKT